MLKNQLFNKLNNIYDNLPKGECTGCGSCCMESVGINLIEFLNIYNYLQDKDELRKISWKNNGLLFYGIYEEKLLSI